MSTSSSLPVARYTTIVDSSGNLDVLPVSNRTIESENETVPAQAALPNANFSFQWNWWSPIESPDSEHYEINITFFVVLFMGIIVFLITFPLSFNYINYDQYGLIRDTYGSVHLNPTYTAGRYFRPIVYSFVTFPSTYQAIDFTTPVFADNGMEFDLNFRFYFRIPINQVGTIYNIYSKNYDSRIIGNSKKVIKNVASGFDVNHYMENRSYVESLLATNISAELSSVIGVEVPVEYCRILNIHFPYTLINTSLDSALALQQNQLNVILQSVQLIQATTDQLVAAINAETQLLLQNADNAANQIVGTANAESNNIINTARSFGIASLFHQLNITSAGDKSKLLKAMAIYDNTFGNVAVMVDLTNSAILNLNGLSSGN